MEITFASICPVGNEYSFIDEEQLHEKRNMYKEIIIIFKIKTLIYLF